MSSFPISRIGDTSNHGGVIISSPISGQHIDGIQAACIGSLHSCPIPFHGITPIVSSPITSVLVDGIIVAMVGSVAGCGAVMVTGSPVANAVG